MKLKWRNEIIKGLADDIPTAERYDWLWWVLIGLISLSGIILMVVRR